MNLLRLFGLSMLLALCASQNGWAQETGPKKNVEISIDIENMNVREYVDYLNGSSPKDYEYQFTCTEAAADILVPTISGIKCRPETALELLETLTANSSVPLIVANHAASENRRIIFVDCANPPTPRVFSVLNVGVALQIVRVSYVESNSNEVKNNGELLESVIRTGLIVAYGHSQEKIELKLHEPTNIMFIGGTQDQIEFVKEIVSALEG